MEEEQIRETIKYPCRKCLLREMDKRALAQFGPGPLGQFKKDWSVERLEQRFAAEAQQLSISSLQKERER